MQECHEFYGGRIGGKMDQQNMSDYQPEMGWQSETRPVQNKKIISQSGFALFVMTLAVILVQSIVEWILNRYQPAILETNWYVWALTAFTVVGVGLPLFYFMTAKIPVSPKGEVIKLKPSTFFMIFFICAAAMYITNYFSIFITFMIAMAKGENFMDLNPLTEVLKNSNYVLTVIYASIVAPIAEELIFRKLLLDRLRRYGDLPAILMTGLAFGLFHMNLSQFFYAAALGFIFAYVTIRTNTVRYSILLHCMINFIGSIVSPLASTKNLMVVSALALWVFTAITVGIVLLALNWRKITLVRGIPLEKKSGYFLNTGTILYTLACLVMIVIVTIS
jgi:membrane protease YdiL (CAAX protease family)